VSRRRRVRGYTVEITNKVINMVMVIRDPVKERKRSFRTWSVSNSRGRTVQVRVALMTEEHTTLGRKVKQTFGPAGVRELLRSMNSDRGARGRRLR